MQLSNHLTARTSRVVFTVLMAMAWAGAADRSQAQVATLSTPTTEPTQQSLGRVAGEWDGVGDVAQALERELPRESFDPQAVVERLSSDPQRLYEFVRDRTRWVAYRGAMRGPVGTLMDGLGNSLDRALLLGDLLRRAGYGVRLANAQLSEASANDLLRRVGATPDSGRPTEPADAAGEQYVRQNAGRFGLDAGQVLRSIDTSRVVAQRRAEEAAQRIVAQAASVTQAVGPIAPAASASPSPVEAMRDHWWVQKRQGEQWIDMDVLAPADAPGKAPASPTQTIALDRTDGALPLDDKQCHQVVINVIVEQSRDGRFAQGVVLSHAIRPAETIGKPIALRHAPANWPADLDLFARDAGERLKRVAMEQRQWTPVLSVGSSRIVQKAFDDQGNVIASAGGIAGAVGGLGERLGGLFGDAEKKTPGVLTAQWVEYEIRAPGQPGQKIRRPLFDLLGPTARNQPAAMKGDLSDAQRLSRGLALIHRIEILPMVGAYAPAFVQHLGMREIVAHRKALGDLMRQANDLKASARTIEEIGRIERNSPMLMALALMRLEWSPVGRDVYLDRPNILTFRTEMGTDATGELMARAGFDIVNNDVGVRGGANGDPWQIRLKQGIADTNAEAMLTPTPGGPVFSTAELMVASGAQSTGWIALRQGDEQAMARLQLPPDVQSRVRADLAAGQVVVLPSKAVKLGQDAYWAWWRLDPATGSVLGMTQAGQGQSMTEYVKIVASVALGMVVGVTTIGGCGGFNESSSGMKKLGCTVCGLVAGLLAYFAAVALMIEAAGATAAGAFITGKGGFAVGTAAGTACNVLSWKGS